MSRNILKKITALLLAVALLVPSFFTAFANEDNLSGHPLATDPTALGSITVHIRTLDLDPPLPPGTPLLPGQGVPIEGVPVRATRVVLTNFDPENPATHPTAVNLADPAWIAANTTPFTPEHGYTALTNAAGTVVFDDLPQGIWLVGQVDAYDGRNNPIPTADRFDPFLVGIPTHMQDGEYRLDVVVWPKVGRERLVDPGKRAAAYFDNIITWEFGVNIPNTIGAAREFYLLDVLDSRLTFTGQADVTGRFSTSAMAFGNLVPVTHFTAEVIEVYFAGQGYRDVVRIALTTAGIAHITANGYLGDGRLYFTMNTTIAGNVSDLGEIRNEAQWRYNPERPWTPDCPVDDPTCDETFPWTPCPEDDPTCLPTCPIEDPECDQIITERFRTLALNILKLSVADRQRLAGAEFSIYREISAEEAAGLPAARQIPANASGAPDPTVWIVPLRDASGLPITGTTGANGELQFNGIVSSANSGNLSGMFWLREVQAPTGFRVINEWMPVRVEVATVNYRNDSNPYTLGTLTAEQQVLRENGQFVNNTVHVNVYNERAGAWQLPETGAFQTIILSGIGITSLAGAWVMLMKRKNKKANVA